VVGMDKNMNQSTRMQVLEKLRRRYETSPNFLRALRP